MRSYRQIGYQKWAHTCQRHQAWMSKRFEEHLLQIFKDAGQFRKRAPQLLGSKKNPDFLIEDTANGSSCYVEAKVVYDPINKHSYSELCLVEALETYHSPNGVAIGLRLERGQLTELPTKQELGQIILWLSTAKLEPLDKTINQSPIFTINEAEYEATALLANVAGNLRVFLDHTSHGTIDPDREDKIDKIIKKHVEEYTPTLLAGVPLIFAFLNCKKHDFLDATTVFYGTQQILLSRDDRSVINREFDGSGIWRTNRIKGNISQSVPAAWVWENPFEPPTLYMNPDGILRNLPSSLFGFKYHYPQRMQNIDLGNLAAPLTDLHPVMADSFRHGRHRFARKHGQRPADQRPPRGIPTPHSPPRAGYVHSSLQTMLVAVRLLPHPSRSPSRHNMVPTW